MFQEIQKLQDKAIRVISFLPKGTSVKEAYSTLKILKIQDFTSLQNALLVKDVFEQKIPSPFMTYLKKPNTQHLHATRSAMIMNQSANEMQKNGRPKFPSALKFCQHEFLSPLENFVI